MWCEQLGARRRDTHSSCDTASLAHTLCKKWTTLHTQTHTLACIKGNTVDVDVKLYQPSLLSMHVKLYSAICCSIFAPPSSPLRNMVEIAEDSSTLWLCLRLIPGVSGCTSCWFILTLDGQMTCLRNTFWTCLLLCREPMAWHSRSPQRWLRPSRGAPWIQPQAKSSHLYQSLQDCAAGSAKVPP